MDTGKKPPLTSLTPVIRGLYPAHPVKAIERATGCSPRQAQRIVETGRVPAHLFAAVVAFLRQSAEHNRRRLDEMDAEIGRFEEAEGATRAETTLGGDPGRAPLGAGRARDAAEIEQRRAAG